MKQDFPHTVSRRGRTALLVGQKQRLSSAEKDQSLVCLALEFAE